jgi:O-antigen ligase
LGVLFFTRDNDAVLIYTYSMNLVLNKLRFPYADDKLFSVLFFIIFLIPLAFYPGLSDPFEGFKFSLLSLLVGAAILYLVARKTTLRYNKFILISLAGFILWSIVATVFSLEPITSVLGFNLRFTSSLYFYLLWGLLLVLFWQTLTKNRVEFLLKALVAVGLAVAGLLILQSFGISHYEGLNPDSRPILPSFLGNPNFSAMFMVGTIPLALMLAHRTVSRKSQIYYLVATFLMILGITMTSSRGSMLALGIELLLFAAITLRYWRPALPKIVAAGVITFVLFVAFYSVYRPNSFTQTANLSERTVSSRLVLWDTVLGMIAQDPITGTGPSTLLFKYQMERPAALASEQVFDDAHNIFLHLATIGGLPLMAFFVLIVVTAIYYGLKRLSAEMDIMTGAILVALIGLIIAMCFNPVVVGCWVLLAALIAFLTYDATIEKKINSWPIKTGAALIAIVFFITGSSVLVSSLISFRARKDYVYKNYERAYQLGSLAAKINPYSNEAWLSWLGASIQLNRDSEYINGLFVRYSKLRPADPETYMNLSTLAAVRYDLTRDKQYLEDSEKYIDYAEFLAPNFGLLQGKMAYLYYLTGQYDKALLRIQRTAVIYPNNYYTWILEAKVHQALGQKEQMIKALEASYHERPIDYIKDTIQALRVASDPREVPFEIYFPPIDI